MAHRLVPRAETDLDEIWYYVAKESGSIEIANRLIDTLILVRIQIKTLRADELLLEKWNHGGA